MPATVGALRVTLGANTAQFEEGMRRAQAVARSTGQNIERSMGGVSARVSQSFAGIRLAANSLGLALGVGFLVSQSRAAFQFAADLGETARSIGVTVEQLQILRRAAIENGASVEGMERAMSILNRTLGQARAGVPEAAQAFRALRIDPRAFTDAGSVLPRVMDAIRNLGTESEQAAAAQRLMGRGASEMIPFLVQGAEGYDRVAEAARAAGLVTQDQADRADAASDRLALLAVTLRTNLASALVDILPYIEGVVSGLAAIASTASQAIGLLNSIRLPGMGEHGPGLGNLLGAVFPALPFPRFGSGWINGQSQSSGRLATAATAPRTTGNLGLDLSGAGRHGGGGGGDRRAEAERKRALRDEARFQEDLRREQIQQLEEQKQRTNDYVEQNNIQARINALNAEQYRTQLDLRVALGDLTREKEQQLLEAYNQTDIERRNTLVASEHADRVREQAQVDENEYNLAKEALQQQEAIAETAEERRRVGLQLLDLDQRYQQLKLQNIVREEQVYDLATRLDAQRRLDALGASFSGQRSSLLRGTRGPLEEYLANLPTTAARAREALQSVAVDGLQAISDGLTAAITGTRKWGDVFKQVATQILADLIKIQIEQRLIPMLANLIPGFGGLNTGTVAPSSWEQVINTVGSLQPRASGGPVLPGRAYVVGERGPEILRMGGSAGHIVSNDNIGGGGIVINQTFAPSFAGNAPTREEMVFLAGQVKHDTIEAVRQIGRRRK